MAGQAVAGAAPFRKETARNRWTGPLLVLLVLVAAFALLAHELRGFRYRDVANAMAALSPQNAGIALALTALAYAILPCYDALALIYAGERLPFSRTAFSSIIAYGLSQTLGFPIFTSSAVRYRFWSAWGLSTAAIARAVGFVAATFTVGLVVIGGVALVLEPAATLARIGLPPLLCRAGGVVLLAAVAAYLILSVVRPTSALRLRAWTFPLPTPRLATAQVAVAAADWIVSGGVLYVLLPDQTAIGFVAFLGLFVLAQFAGFVSHVPGGVGVFETIVLVLLRPYLAPDQTLAVLLAYRAIYYLVPFALALAALGTYEVLGRRSRIAAAATSTASFVARWAPPILPQVLSAATFIGGVILLFSGATPSAHGRVRALDESLPLGVIEVAHFVASLAGSGLIVLAWAIRRRIDAAYGLTLALLVIGVVTSVLKGLDYEEAMLLGAVIVTLLPARRVLYRKASLTSEPLSPAWIITMCAVIAATIWLGLFSFKHVEYRADIWWRFATNGDAPRSLRAMAGAVGLLFVFAIMRLVRHAEARPPLPTEEELERARSIVLASHDTWTNLALLGDKSLLFSENEDAFLMYGVSGRSWVALGDPVGAPAAKRELAWKFREQADRHGAWTVFYQVGTENLPLYIDLGLNLLKVGEEAVVMLDDFSLEGSQRKKLRATRSEVGVRGGASVEVLPPEAVPAALVELREISDAWLESKSTREKGFSLGYFDERYLCNFPVAIARINDRIVAFANLWVGAGNTELSVDLMRYRPEAPRGMMEFLFIELLLWGKANGYKRFSLGMAPLAGLETRALAPLWSRAGAFIYRHGEHFYNFKGLRLYKNKFDPVWEARYLASPGGLVLPRVLANVASLISGGIRGVVAK